MRAVSGLPAPISANLLQQFFAGCRSHRHPPLMRLQDDNRPLLARRPDADQGAATDVRMLVENCLAPDGKHATVGRFGRCGPLGRRTRNRPLIVQVAGVAHAVPEPGAVDDFCPGRWILAA